jgi:hypothetical protein
MALDLRRVFGDRFVALLAGAADTAAAFATSIRPDDLEALAPLAESWHRDGVETPLVMTPDEFHRSLDTFPAEYQALIDHHVVIDGSDPIAGAVVRNEDLRRACEAQARGHLIHLRQGWIEAGSHPHGLAELIEASARPLRQVLDNLSRLHGEHAVDGTSLAAFAERHAGMPASLVSAVLAVEDAPERSRALVPRMAEYLAASERLWVFVDLWRTR